jgi:DNA-binding ferritin-like protein (Dps family)
MVNPLELVIGAKKDKEIWRALQKRVQTLPDDYLFVYKKLQDYMFGQAGGDGRDMVALLSDLVDIFEEGVADGREVRSIIGDDPAAFADELVRNAHTWQNDTRTKLNQSIDKKLGSDNG